MAIVHLLILHAPSVQPNARLQPHTLVNIVCFPYVLIFDLSLSVLFNSLVFFLLICYLYVTYLVIYTTYIAIY